MNDAWDDDLDFTLKEGDQFVLFLSDQTLFALPSADVVEIIEFPPITTIAMINPSILGVANIRGNIIGIIDMARLIWGHPTSLTPRTSVIIVRLHVEDEILSIGLIVDEILEVETFNPSDFLECPPFGLKIEKKYIQSIIAYKENYIMLLDLKNLLNIHSLSEPKGLT